MANDTHTETEPGDGAERGGRRMVGGGIQTPREKLSCLFKLGELFLFLELFG